MAAHRQLVLLHFMLLGALAVVPLVLQDSIFTLRLFNQVFLNTTILLGFVVVLGFAKQFSLAQVAFYGIGAYTVAVLTARYGWNFFVALPAAVAFAALVGAVIAVPAARFHGPWLSLVTLAFAEIIRILLIRMKPVTGGAGGFYNIPRPALGDVILQREHHYYFLFLSVVALVYLLVWRIRHSQLGRTWLAIGDNPDIAASLGTNVFAHQVLVFAVGAGIAGLAGGCFAAYATFVSPESFGLAHTIHFLTMLVAGGLESIGGAMLSAIFFAVASDQLIALHPWDLIIEGLIIVLIMNFLPRGLGGLLQTARSKWESAFATRRLHVHPRNP